MSEIQKTGTFAVIALVLVGLALVTRPNVSQRRELVQEQGEPLCPQLSDPGVPKALEIFEFDDEVGTVKPLRVHFKNNRWSIPSHNDYPADAEDRLYKTAGAVIGLRKDSFVTDKKEEHAELGVVDPQQEGSSTRGWGTRLTLYDEADNKVADIIFGKKIEGKTGFRYVRLAGDDRVYSIKCDDVDLSTRFVDWIDTDLLKVSSFDLEKVVLKDYHVDIRRQRVEDRGTLTLNKEADNWKLDGLAANEETNTSKALDLASELSNLKIVGVRPKPPGLTPDLRTVEGGFLADSMANRGFFVTQAGLYSNDGETLATTKDGLVYTLRFGGAFIAEGEDLSAGKKDEKVKEPSKESKESKDLKGKKDEKGKAETKESSPGATVQEHRFVLVSVAFDESKFPPIPDLPPVADKPGEAAKGAEAKSKDQPAEKAKPADAKAEEKKAADAKAEEKKAADAKAETKVDPEAKKKAEEEAKKKAEEERKKQEDELKRKREERDKKIADGKKKAKELSDRHANWYYVIANDSFKKIDVNRADLVKEKEKKEEEKKADEKKAEGKKDETKPATPVPPPMPKEPAKDVKPAAKKGEMKSKAATPASKEPAKETKPASKKEDAKAGAGASAPTSKGAPKDTKPTPKKEEAKPAVAPPAPKTPSKEAAKK